MLASTTALVAGPSRADVLTVSFDALRTDWDQNEPGLAPTQVSAPDFGKLFATQLNGQVYAQQVVSHGVLLAATENNWVYGMDPATGAIKWQRNVGPAWPAATLGCGDLTPNVGITATPVVDQSTGTAYFTAKVNDGPTPQSPHWYLHAIDLTTGAERAGFPTRIGGPTFDAETAMQRPGLLLLDGVVYAAFASHCDIGPYVGYVAGVNARTGVQTTLFSTEAGSTDGEAGIWQSGGGLVSDGPGQIILTTGNGVSPAPGPGTAPPDELGESVVRLQVNADGSLSAKDFFSPVNNTQLNRDDADLGSGAPMGIPDGYGTTDHPHLLVQIGKSGQLYLLDRDHLGGDAQGPGATDAVLQSSGPYQGVWGHPAFWGGGTGYVYLISDGGPMYAFQLEANGSGVPNLALVGTTSRTWSWGSGSPVVTSTGATHGSALVWGVYSSGKSGTGGLLQAYDAVPVDGVLQLRYSVPIGTAAKFTVPATDSGRVYLGTRDGVVYGFGHPTSSPLTGTDTNFGYVPVSTSSTRTVTLTAAKALTINQIAATGPFAISSTAPAPGTALAPGDTETLSVTANPTTAGPVSGSLQLTTSAGAVTFGLEVDGAAPGVAGSPSTVNFGQVPTGGRVTYAVSIMNTDSAATTVSSVTGPSGAFDASLPAPGTTIAGGGSIAVPVTFAPSAVGASTSSLMVTTPSGSTTVTLNGSAVAGAPHLALSTTSVDFGAITVGSHAQASFLLSNTGNIVLNLDKAPPPVTPFAASDAISEGQQLSPGARLLATITFAPTHAGRFSGTYAITGNDGSGPQTISITGTGVGPGPVAISGPANGSWRRNGSGHLSGADLILTPASPWLHGDAVYHAPVFGAGLRATFRISIRGGTGGAGLAFALLDANRSSPWSLGATGPGLGWAGLSGVAAVIGAGATAPANAIGIANGPNPTGPGLKLAAGARVPQDLRAGSHLITVTTTATTMTIRVDSGPPLTARVAVPQRALLAFTAGTGRLTEIHDVSDVTITQRVPVGQIVGVSNRCIDVRGTLDPRGTSLQMYACNTTAAEHWMLVADRTIRALGACLNVEGGARTNGTRVDLMACNGSGAQIWVPQATGRLFNPQSGKCLQGISPTGALRSPLAIWTCSTAVNERWRLPR